MGYKPLSSPESILQRILFIVNIRVAVALWSCHQAGNLRVGV